jgi:3-methyladenine DNA glycosylase AlkD
MNSLNELKKELKSLSNPAKIGVFQKFFKTGKGEYGEGDIFLGITVPVQRVVAKKYIDINLNDVFILLKDPIHEFRLTSLFILVMKYRKSDKTGKEKITKLYLKNTKNVNNWDLVDTSASIILGEYLLDKPRGIIFKLAKSENLWERRIAVLSTYAFLRNNDFDDAIKIYTMLLRDKHDLMHKAVGWMLREAGKRKINVLINFLDRNCTVMPRTMLRYAIEKLPEKQRKYYLNRK